MNYHNTDDGPKPCRAQTPESCTAKRLDGTVPQHYANEREANAAWNHEMEDKYGEVATLSKTRAGSSAREQALQDLERSIDQHTTKIRFYEEGAKNMRALNLTEAYNLAMSEHRGVWEKGDIYSASTSAEVANAFEENKKPYTTALAALQRDQKFLSTAPEDYRRDAQGTPAIQDAHLEVLYPSKRFPATLDQMRERAGCRTPRETAVFEKALEEAKSFGWLTQEGDKLYTTDEGAERLREGRDRQWRERQG